MERAQLLRVWRPGFWLWLGENLILIKRSLSSYKDMTLVYVPAC